MSRTLDANITSAITSDNIEPFFAFQIAFDTQTLYLYTGVGELTIGGNTYRGVGTVLNFDNVEESSDIGAKNVTLTLSGIPSTNLSLALTEPYQGREVTILFGIRNANLLFLGSEDGEFILTEAGVLIDFSDTGLDNDASSTLFVGYLDQMDINEGVEFSSITVRLESKLLELNRAKVLRHLRSYQRKGWNSFQKMSASINSNRRFNNPC